MWCVEQEQDSVAQRVLAAVAVKDPRGGCLPRAEPASREPSHSPKAEVGCLAEVFKSSTAARPRNVMDEMMNNE